MVDVEGCRFVGVLLNIRAASKITLLLVDFVSGFLELSLEVFESDFLVGRDTSEFLS